MFIIKESAEAILTLFLIAMLGYGLGRVRIGGISLGTAAIFIIGLIFGHFGASLPDMLQNTGLVLFITSVGFSAGPGFMRRLRKNGLAYGALCLTIALSGAAVVIAAVKLSGIEAPLAAGMMTGAFTTSPGFAAAKEAVAASPEAVSMVAAGYGIVYPVGVITKVLFIQAVPRLLKSDMQKERMLIATPEAQGVARENARLFQMDGMGLFSFSAAIVLGILLGGILIPLPGGGTFALGATGGPLITGLLFGHLGSIGRLSLRVDRSLINPAKELGLLLFFAGAGVEGGAGLLEILSRHGFMLIFIGFILVAVPLGAGYVMFRYVLRLPLLDGLGSIVAGMTCTPSLAMLIKTAETDDVAFAYATTYPIALFTLVLLAQLLVFVR